VNKCIPNIVTLFLKDHTYVIWMTVQADGLALTWAGGWPLLLLADLFC
jgi:hypothetical protein